MEERMRFLAAVLLASFALNPSAAATDQAKSISAAALFSAARNAVGDEQRLIAVRTAVLEGTRRVANQWAPEGSDFRTYPSEFRIMFPDCFLERTVIGTQLLPADRGFLRGTPLVRDDNDTARRNFATLALSVLMRPDTAILPLRLQPTVIEGRTLTFLGSGGFKLTMDVDPATHLPVRLSSVVAIDNPPGSETVVWLLEDRRLTDGLSLPFRIVRMQANRVRDVLLTNTVRLNSALSEADFAARVAGRSAH
jgi:hypothetical protein